MARQWEKVAATPDMLAQRKTVIERLNLKPGESVLDVGSGNGIFARDISEMVGPTGTVCGVDNAEAMVNLAKGTCPAGEFLQADATDLSQADETIDVVTATALLCFVVDVDRALREFWRVLKHGGRVVLLETDWRSLLWNCRDEALMRRAIDLFTGPLVDVSIPRTLSRRLTGAGFEITDRRTITVLNWEPDPDSYSQQTVGFIKSMMEASPNFTADDWKTWNDDQKSTADAGEFMLSVNRYIFSAVKH